jgi:signal transduction histidine kinase
MASSETTSEALDEDRERTDFERHFKGAHEHPGVGLGLFISKSLVDAQGGRIWCENRSDGPGAVFSFTLPGR